MRGVAIQVSYATLASLGLLLGVSLLFYYFPQLDLWPAHELYVGNGKFYWSLNNLSHVIDGPVDLFLKFGFLVSFVCYLAICAFKLKLPQQLHQKLIFLYTTILCAELLIINFILKNHWGRARPHQLAEFLGPEKSHFTNAWQYSHECIQNCSFTSGHAGMAACTALLAVFLPKAWRPVYLAIAVAFTVLAAFTRMAHGAHFLSDVIISPLIIWATAMMVKDTMQLKL